MRIHHTLFKNYKFDLSSSLNKELLFGNVGIIITTIIVLSVRMFGLVDKGPYNIDEVTLHHQAMQSMFNTGIVPLHISNGFLMMIGLFIKLFGLNHELYVVAVAIINLLSIAIMPISYFTIRSLTKNNILAWMSALCIGLSAPYIYENYWHYGAGLAAMFVYASACLIVIFFADPSEGRNNVIRLSSAGILLGIGHTCHRSSIFMIVTIIFILLIFLSIRYFRGEISLKWAVRFFVLPCICFWVPLLGIHFLVPLYHKLRFGTNYSDVVSDMYFYDVHDYMGSLVRNYLNNFSLSKAENRSILKNMWAIPYATYIIMGWAHVMLIFIGCWFCMKNKGYRYLIFFLLFYLIWLIPASFAFPGIYLRVMIPALVMTTVMLSCGWYQICLWTKDILIRFKISNLFIKMSLFAIMLYFTTACIFRPGVLLIQNSSTGYRDIIDWSLEKKVEPTKILSYNHLMSYVYLKYWPVNPVDTKEDVNKLRELIKDVKNKYDYFVIETTNINTVYGTLLLMNEKPEKPYYIEPVKIIKHNIGHTDLHLMAQGGISEYMKFKNNAVMNLYSKNHIYIIETKKINEPGTGS